jgi:hypothetical protein
MLLTHDAGSPLLDSRTERGRARAIIQNRVSLRPWPIDDRASVQLEGTRPVRTPFDPRPYLRELEDGSEHLDLKWQLVWLRSEHPDARIETQLVPTGEDLALCRATVYLASGASASAHGSAKLDGSADALFELAENRALARALAALGYGTEFAEEDHLEARPRLTPPVALMKARALKERDDAALYDEPDDEELPEDDAPPLLPQPRQPERPPAPRTGADVNWSKFWEWARPRGYRSAPELSEMLGVDILALTPAEVRKLLVRYELDHPPSGSVE